MSVQKTPRFGKERILTNPTDSILRRPEDLWSDKGTPFPKKLLKKFSKFSDSCSLIRELKKETHRVVEYLITQGQLESDVVDEFDKTGTLSHYLILNLACLEKTLTERGERLPPHAQVTERMSETEAERQTAFSQLQRRKAQARLKDAEERRRSKEKSTAEQPEDQRRIDNERREEEKRSEIDPPRRSRSRERVVDRRAESWSRNQTSQRVGGGSRPKSRNSTHREYRERRNTNAGQDRRDEGSRQQRSGARTPQRQRPSSQRRRGRSLSRRGGLSSELRVRQNDTGNDPWRLHRPSSIGKRRGRPRETGQRERRREDIS